MDSLYASIGLALYLRHDTIRRRHLAFSTQRLLRGAANAWSCASTGRPIAAGLARREPIVYSRDIRRLSRSRIYPHVSARRHCPNIDLLTNKHNASCPLNLGLCLAQRREAYTLATALIYLEESTITAACAL